MFRNSSRLIYRKLRKNIQNKPYSIRRLSTRLSTSDPFKIESTLSQDQVMVMDMVRKYSRQELLPKIEELNTNNTHHPNLMKDFGELGILGSFISGYGCPGMDYVTYGLINREIEYVDSAFRSSLSVQSSLVMNPIYKFGSDYLKNKYLPELASGKMVGCFGLTEPMAGSDPSSMKTMALKDGDGFYRLTGEKMWITNSPISDMMVVWAKTPNDSGELKVKGFVLDRDMNGIDTPPIHGKMSLRASSTGSIVMTDVKVPTTHMLDVEGMRGPFECLNSARYGISWGVLGAAGHCLDVASEYTLDRTQFNKPLAANQLIQYKLAQATTDLGASFLMANRLGEMKDELELNSNSRFSNQDIINLTSVCKRNNVQKALQIAGVCRDMLGGNGITEEYHIMRHLNNLEAVNTYEGTSDIHALIIGRAITGIPSF